MMIATLAHNCPWCYHALDGLVFATWEDGKLRSLTQTKQIGRHDYTWVHSSGGCFVPKLQRVTGFADPGSAMQPLREVVNGETE